MATTLFRWSDGTDDYLDRCVQWVLKCTQRLIVSRRQNIEGQLRDGGRQSTSLEPQAPRPEASDLDGSSRLAAMRLALDLDDDAFTLFILSLAPDIAPEIARAWSMLDAAPGASRGREVLTLRLAIALLGRGAWGAESLRRHLSPQGTLTRFDLVRLISDQRLESACSVCPNPEVYDALHGSDHLCVSLAEYAKIETPSNQEDLLLGEDEREHLVQISDRLHNARQEGSLPPIVVIYGPPGTGKLARAQVLAMASPALDQPTPQLLSLDLSAVPHERLREPRLAHTLEREALVRGAWIYLYGWSRLERESRAAAAVLFQRLEGHPKPWFVASSRSQQPVLDVRRACGYVETFMPSSADAELLWERALSSLVLADDVDLAAIAHEYPLSPGDIVAVAEIAAEASALRGMAQIESHDLVQAIQGRTEHSLHELATRVRARPRLSDLVVTPDIATEIETMIARARHSVTVFERWGFAQHTRRTRGFSALFHGASGTGKTMSSAIVAGELGLELYRIDLSQVVSKYIGETEKNLGRIFDEAERANVMLLFDEADSLFAKRTNVSSSHDRYANMEVNFLLQRLDEFGGVSVLTSNFGSELDTALVRRLDYRIEFPFPDAELREQLWQRLMPDDAEVSDDIDYLALAEEFELAGGHIRNALLRAAFTAAAKEKAIDHELLLSACLLEMRSMGHLVAERDYRRSGDW